MSDELRVQLPQTSRSGRVVKKSLKWRESEETYSIDEMDDEQSPRRNQERFGGKFPSLSALLQTGQWSVRSSDADPSPSFSGRRVDSCRRRNRVSACEIARGSKRKQAANPPSEYCANSVSSWRLSKSIEVTSASSSETISASSDGSSSSEYGQHRDLSSTSESSSDSDYFPEKASDTGKSSASDDKRDADNEQSAVSKTRAVDDTTNGGAKAIRNRKTSRAIVNRTAKSRKASAARVGGRRKMTPYMLWSNANRKRIVATHKDLSLQLINRKVGEEWKALPEKEKDLWKRKAKQESSTTSTVRGGAVQNSDGIPPHSNVPAASSEVLGIAPIDVASHLTLLGDCLTAIGEKLLEANCEPSREGVNSVLLDALMCAVGPLLCLSRNIAGLENLPEDTFKKTLDHVAYFFPGI